ncbi:MAG: UDP-N-acetylmuramoyl-L-alanyl-D-glutamate--2,6-diaminopimelate ligase [Clostridia bacterium]|nr:UDP-N-acetylmuramoyl-L-alanyl-D-glutamate--2,6-diaminopimelate ligase [Clostridia bacterium]
MEKKNLIYRKNVSLKQILLMLQKENLVLEYGRNIDLSKVYIEYISYNSNDIRENTLFICKGQKFKTEYLINSVDKGAIAYISEKKYIISNENIGYIKVSDIKKAMAVVAEYIYGYEYNRLKIVGITGTKGKTTTTNYLKNILNKYDNNKCAYISTMHIYTGSTDEDNHLTTPESLDLHKYFFEANKNDFHFLVMEVSSQAYKEDRVYGIKFDVGVFLNISEDHISPIEHSSFSDYFNCKLELLKNSKIDIINNNSDYIESIKYASKSASDMITFGSNKNSDYYATDIKKEQIGYSFTVKSDKYKYEKIFKTQLEGRFNVENALAAIVIAKSLGVDDDSIYEGIYSTQILGRMNIFKKDNIIVIVDYAHNMLSFQKLFETIKVDYPGSKIKSIFGCPGNKAYTRRKDLGTLAGQNSNYVCITSDDPQYEKVINICRDISTYVEKYNPNYEIIEDRKSAIIKVIKEALLSEEQQVIVLAGKGGETTQKIDGKLMDYEGDINIVKSLLKNY